MKDVPGELAFDGSHNTVTGWRMWLLSGSRLAAWAMRYTWAAGPNTASCLGRDVEIGDHRAPGRTCRCGFWAVFDPSDCMALLRRNGVAEGIVLGLIQGWGDVAIHGNEGFRAEYARVVCLFTDRIMDGMPSWVTRLDERRLTLRARHLRRASEHYGVPLISLRDADSTGLLAEFGVVAHLDRLRLHFDEVTGL